MGAAVIAAASLGLSSCEDRLDIVPKGSTTLNTVDELESLINQRWRIYDTDLQHALLTGMVYPAWTAYTKYGKVKNSEEYAYMYGDESVDRVNLNDEDWRYYEPYKHINYCNIMMSKLGDASGDGAKKERLMAEGRVLRAWYHFIVVNYFAQPYDEATAADLGGIPYVDNTDSGETKAKLSLKDTYARILGDCTDEVIAKLKPGLTTDPNRFEQDFGYAVRAMALFQMKDYDEALKYGLLALSANPFIEDRSGIVSSGMWDCGFESPDNYLFINANSNTNGCTLSGFPIPAENMALFEQGDYLRDYSFGDGLNPEWGSFDDGTTWGYGAPGSWMYKGSGARINVYGINSEMIYYLCAECLIRQGKVDEGLDKVDQVRQKRIHPDFYTPFKGRTTDQKEAMALLWDAKRIEFIICPVIYWDIKRRNTDPEYRVNVERTLPDGTHVSIRHDSPLWVRPFPMNATNYNPTLTQNY